jgi:aspartate aminotransferase-like enzyme
MVTATDNSFYPRRKLVMLPGPTNVPERILLAMARPMINHRGPEFHQLYEGILRKSKELFRTKEGEVVVVSASGTGGVEAAALNVVRPGDKVVVPVFGEFGERMVEHVKRAGGSVVEVRAPYGTAPEPSEVESALKSSGAKALFVVYNDTSPGVTYRWLRDVSRAAKDVGAFVVVDAISVFGGDELPQDDWGIDMVVAGAQKCLSLPPGITLISVSRELKDYISRNPPSTTIYFDLSKYFEFNKKLEIPFTPAIPIFYALDESLNMVLEEGLDKRIERHRLAAGAYYSALEAAGLKPFVEPRVRSNVVIAVQYPPGVDDAVFRDLLDRKFGVVVAGGFGSLRGKIFRIGNMGDISPINITQTLLGIAGALSDLGVRVDASAMLAAARDYLKPLMS